MNFISLEFFCLFVIFVGATYLIQSSIGRKYILLFIGCLFYGYWDWRFLSLLFFVTIFDFYISKLIFNLSSPRWKKIALSVSVIVNLGLLFFFKYYNFFIDNLERLFPAQALFPNLEIILPIGISFYTFETLSYVIDVYRGDIQPTDSLLDYAIFISFFPRLVAGPIMRAKAFLTQLQPGINLTLENIGQGLQIFLRGMIKKMVIADNLAIMVDQVYQAPDMFSPLTVWGAVFSYSVQILCDFSGYTDMALGLGMVMGIRLPQNFNLPYTAQSFSEFWRRWHITLSTWLRDYLYISLGGNRKGNIRTYINLTVTMLLGGLWHGASWNFVLWGGLHGLYLCLERLFVPSKKRSTLPQQPFSVINALIIFVVVSLTWIFFRSPSLAITIAMFKKVAFIEMQGLHWYFTPAYWFTPIVIIGGLLVRKYPIKWPLLSTNDNFFGAWILFWVLFVYFFTPLEISPFIYFQF